MDLEQSGECFVKLFDDIPSSKSLPETHPELETTDTSQLTYLINVEQIDGTSQVVEINEASARALGLFANGSNNPSEAPNSINQQVKNLNKTIARRHIRKKPPLKKSQPNGDSPSNDPELPVKPLGSCENPIEIIKDGEVLHSTQDLSEDHLQQIAEALHCSQVKTEQEEEPVTEDAANVVYHVVFPDELNLKPKLDKPHKRGRPKKRPYCGDKKPDVKPVEEARPVKNVRTRSGRVTRPPQHIKKDFKKIVTSEVDNMETDLKTIEFEPLKTNQAPTCGDAPIKINQLETHQRKRSIASQFRCPKCKKAYLGHSKMLKHLQKHPDHGPIPDHCKSRHNDTWNFLIDLANKNPVGQRGPKFCRELVTFLHNLRILAKMFFRPVTNIDKNLYFVDGALAGVLGIESGNYTLYENELQKEVSMFEFLKSNRGRDSNPELGPSIPVDPEVDAKILTENFDLDAFVQTCQTNNSEEIPHINNTTDAVNGRCSTPNTHQSSPHSKSQLISKKPPSPCTMDVTFHSDKLSFDTIQNSPHNGFDLNCDIASTKAFHPGLHIISQFDQSEKTKVPTNGLTHEPNHAKSINPDLSLHGELLSDNSLLNSLPLLNNVDGAHVTNLLDNSTSSDEVMNVDQFVNERFKNLTESDLELPNTALNLDLPSLDLFQFHTS